MLGFEIITHLFNKKNIKTISFDFLFTVSDLLFQSNNRKRKLLNVKRRLVQQKAFLPLNFLIAMHASTLEIHTHTTNNSKYFNKAQTEKRRRFKKIFLLTLKV